MALADMCDRHPLVPLVFDRRLGDRNAGPVEIRLPATEHEMKICSACMTELVEWIGVRTPTGYTGTLTGLEKLFHLPIVAADEEVKPLPKLRPAQPPEFLAEKRPGGA